MIWVKDDCSDLNNLNLNKTETYCPIESSELGVTGLILEAGFKKLDDKPVVVATHNSNDIIVYANHTGKKTKENFRVPAGCIWKSPGKRWMDGFPLFNIILTLRDSDLRKGK